MVRQHIRSINHFYLKIPGVVEGWAVVKEIRVNQLDTRLWDEARQGDFVYRPLTATFQHDSETVQQLYFTGNDTPLEVTPEHPIYSIDRNDFVHAGSLRIGEQVKTRQGITTLKQRKQLSGTHRVYNLEVYRDHNFMVSMDNILVHNSQDKGSYGGGTRYNNPQTHKEDLAKQAGIPQHIDLSKPNNVYGLDSQKLKTHFEMNGYRVNTTKDAPKGSGNAQVYTIHDHGSISKIQHSPSTSHLPFKERSQHQGEYIKFTLKGTKRDNYGNKHVYVINPNTFVGTAKKSSTVYNQQGQRMQFVNGKYKVVN